MIKIAVDTEEELNVVRRALLTETCSHMPDCTKTQTRVDCAECIDRYCKDKVCLYKKEIVEIPAPIVV